MKELLFKILEEKGLLRENMEEVARNKIEKQGNEIVLTGNKVGLLVLAEYIVNVALSGKKGKHIHLDENNFFDEGTLEFIISLEEDSKEDK